jgi:hypothetical protein
MDGNKPKQRVEKPVDKQSNVNLTPTPKQIEIREEDLDKEFQTPDYRPQSFFTRKRPMSKTKKKKLRKIAYKSKRLNRIRNSNK